MKVASASRDELRDRIELYFRTDARLGKIEMVLLDLGGRRSQAGGMELWVV